MKNKELEAKIILYDKTTNEHLKVTIIKRTIEQISKFICHLSDTLEVIDLEIRIRN